MKSGTRSDDTVAMARCMSRRLSLAWLPWVVIGCSDDVSEAVTGGTGGTDGTGFSSSAEIGDTVLDVSSNPSEPDTTISTDTLTTFDTVTDSDVTSASTDLTDTVSTTTPETTSDATVTDATTTDEPTTDEPTTNEPTTDATVTDATTTDPTTTDATTTDGTTTDATVTDATTTDGTTTGDTDSGGGGFPDAPAFGTNILDLDLVGVWGLNWDQPAGFDSVLDIDDMGNFVWTETSADCADTTVASGHLWVEGAQVVMHVEVWDRQLPWDTEAVLGESFDPPFRLRMSFSLQGGGVDSYLALAAPSRITEAAPYAGESYIRLSTAGVHLGGTWRGEAELEAIPLGASDPVVIVRDVYQALLDAEQAPDAPEGTGVRATNTTYFPMPVAFDTFDGGNWTCLGGCPQPSGTTLVDDNNLYTYGPYGGQTHLLTFASGRTFRGGYASDCP